MIDTQLYQPYNKIILLMYHGTPKSKPFNKYALRSTQFTSHLQFLEQSGWHTALFSDLSKPDSLPKKTVILTFDDGYADNYEGAFQQLLEYDMKATWFITTDSIDNHAHWLGNTNEQTKMLTQQQLFDMHIAGMEIASHTCTHPDLSTLSLSRQIDELTRSKAILEEIISFPVNSFAYPFGRYNEDSLLAVKKADYQLACTTRSGWFRVDENPLLIRRISIFAGDSAAILARKLTFADNDVSWKKLAGYYRRRMLDKFNLIR